MVVKGNTSSSEKRYNNDLPYGYDEWVNLAKSSEANDRCEALDNLSDSVPDDVVRNIVVELLRDPVPLVRICAADAARLLQGMPEVVEALRLMVQQETDDLAIAFGYESLGRIGDIQDIPIFSRAIERASTNKRVRLAALSGFCILLRRMFLFDIYALFKAKDSDLCLVAARKFIHMVEDEKALEHWLVDVIETPSSKDSMLEFSESIQEFMQTLRAKDFGRTAE